MKKAIKKNKEEEIKIDENKVGFLKDYNELVKKWGYALRPVIKFELIRVAPVVKKDGGIIK